MLNAWMNAAVDLTLLLCVCLLAIALLRPLMRAAGGPRAQYALWLALPLCLLVSRLPAPPVSMAITPTELQQSLDKGKYQAREFLWEPAPARSPGSQQLPAAKPRTGLQQALLCAWLLGCALLLSALLAQHRRWRRQLQWDTSAAQWSLPAGYSPAVVGLLRPRLALPKDFATRFEAREQSLILAHETVHARRRDGLWNALAVGMCVLQWFNPLAWWALRRFQRDQELACDAAALAALPAEQRRPYWDALLKAHELSPSSALSRGWRSTHPLIERLRWVQQGSQGRVRAALWWTVPLATLGLAGAVYATHGAAVVDFGHFNASKWSTPIGRVEIRTQIGTGTWVQESIDLASTQMQTSSSTNSLMGRPVFAQSLGIEANEHGQLTAWLNLADPPPAEQPRAPGWPVLGQLRATPEQGWQHLAVRTTAGDWVRAELRIRRLPPAEAQH